MEEKFQPGYEEKDDRTHRLYEKLEANRREISKKFTTLSTYRSKTSNLRETVTQKDEQLQRVKQQPEVTKLNRKLCETLTENKTRFCMVKVERVDP